ncbi:MAG: tRNA glutamyl-Q(34) synthetase GluQRS [Alphaproteobacteria bacterium]|nr:tRNA glutamyl-Q(34) synthetase GluQRS [Alphaproteobacteria bacterium]
MPLTRFAPSPTGYLHLGHAYSALLAAESSAFLLRIEDIDPVRCKPEFTDAIFEDLHWLGLTWPEPVRRQSQHLADYAATLDRLRSMGLVYPCFCTRGEIEREAQSAVHAPHALGLLYPGTCRSLSERERAEKLERRFAANWRLDVGAALRLTGSLFWHDRAKGRVEARPEIFGDVVLARKDVATSYHLSVTVDDHVQGISLVTRGEDLFTSTHIHRLLQALLGYETPEYFHHALLKDAAGRRYAKRDKSVTLRHLREQGKTAQEIVGEVFCR